MARNYIAPGEHLDYTAGAAIATGDVIVFTDTIGIALGAVASGKAGVARIEGVFRLAKLSTDNIAQGQKVYWDNTNKRITLTSASNTYAGRAYLAAAAATTTCQVKINI